MHHPDNAARLYDALAARYDDFFAADGYRRIYDEIAWDLVAECLPPGQARIIDAGCGTGRWAAKWVASGHSVIGIESSPGMIAALRGKRLGERFELLENGMEQAEVPENAADLVVAMGSLQYTADPCAMVARLARWARPGGWVCVHTDSHQALVLELLRTGRIDEAFSRLDQSVGVWSVAGQQADVHLLDRRRLEAAFAAAGLSAISSHGLLVTATAWGRERYSEAAVEDAETFLALERRLARYPLLADSGKHILVRGQRP